MLDNKQYSKVPISTNKSFGYTFSVIFLIFSIYFLYKENDLNLIFFIITFCLLLITILKPKYLSIPNKIWFKIGMFLSNYIITPIIMFLIFFLVVTPIGFLMKIFSRKKNKKELTYWIKRSEELSKDMKNQF